MDCEEMERRERRRSVFRFLSKREACAFPRQTLVLAFSARSRHSDQVFLRPDVVGTYAVIIDERAKRSLFISNDVILISEQG